MHEHDKPAVVVIAVEYVCYKARQPVGEDELQKCAPQKCEKEYLKPFPAHLAALSYLRQKACSAKYRAGDNCRKECYKKAVVYQILFRLGLAALQIEQICRALEGVKRKTYRQKELRHGYRHAKKAQHEVDIAEQKARVFEHDKNDEIENKCPRIDSAALFLTLLLRTDAPAEIGHGDTHGKNQQIFQIIAGIEYNACCKQHYILSARGFPAQHVKEEAQRQKQCPELKAYK